MVPVYALQVQGSPDVQRPPSARYSSLQAKLLDAQAALRASEEKVAELGAARTALAVAVNTIGELASYAPQASKPSTDFIIALGKGKAMYQGMVQSEADKCTSLDDLEALLRKLPEQDVVVDLKKRALKYSSTSARGIHLGRIAVSPLVGTLVATRKVQLHGHPC